MFAHELRFIELLFLEMDLNFLMQVALRKIAFLPYGYLLDKYRWQIFRGEITNSNYNSEYWKMR